MASINTQPIDAFLHELSRRKGTDLVLSAGAPPVVRVDGELESLSGAALSPAETSKIVRDTLGTDLWHVFVRDKEVDFAFSWEAFRLRGNAFHQRGSVAMALRLIPFEIPTFEELGVPDNVRGWADLFQGLILVTGPTGSGKSTTLAAMIDAINSKRACHILTIEDPVEYLHRHKRSVVNQRELGTDCETFDRALRSALREDPDVMLVGEMRDPETIQTVLTIAETGHLVFATLHTNDAAQAIDRIVDVFPGDRQQQIRVQLAGSLTGILSQRLIPRIGGGRVAAFEVLQGTFAIRNLIREGKSSQLRNLISTGSRFGMQTLEASLSELVTAGVVEYEEALSRSLYPRDVVQPQHAAAPRPT